MTQVGELIEDANKKWEERNERAREQGEPELPPMLPLIRLKVSSPHTTELSVLKFV